LARIFFGAIDTTTLNNVRKVVTVLTF